MKQFSKKYGHRSSSSRVGVPGGSANNGSDPSCYFSGDTPLARGGSQENLLAKLKVLVRYSTICASARRGVVLIFSVNGQITSFLNIAHRILDLITRPSTAPQVSVRKLDINAAGLQAAHVALIVTSAVVHVHPTNQTTGIKKIARWTRTQRTSSRCSQPCACMSGECIRKE